jgi:hypothetical protein
VYKQLRKLADHANEKQQLVAEQNEEPQPRKAEQNVEPQPRKAEQRNVVVKLIVN